MSRRRLWIGALSIVGAALLLASCGGGYGGDDEAASQAAQASQQADQTAQTGQVQEDQPEARVQVIRDRGTLGDPDAPVVIEEYSDFL